MKTFHYHTKYKLILGDLHTPVTTYLKLRDLFPQSALMESSDYHGSENNRSFIGLDPIASVSVGHGKAVMVYPDRSREELDLTESFRPENAISKFLSRFKVEGEYARYCGLYGYTTFNAIRYFEHIPIKDSKDSKNDAPDMLYILYKYLIVFNDFTSEMTLVEMQNENEPDHIEEVKKAIENRNYTTYQFRATGPVTSTLTDEEHKANIRRGIGHCLRGDVFQIVLSRRFVQRYEGDDFQLYRALRSINPSPYLFYFDFGGFRIFGSSPETHCRIEGRHATIDPIAGTVRRNGDKEKDRILAEQLLKDPKENAEHVMLVDLARNDLSRNCHDVHPGFLQGSPILQSCHPPGKPGKRRTGRGGRSHQDIRRHVSGRHAERSAESKSHAAHQRNGAAQPRRIRRMHRIYRIRRIAQPGHHHPHFRKPQQRTLVSGRRRNRGQKQ